MSHLVLRVSSCRVLVLFLVGLVLLLFWKTPGFLLSPILQHVGIANQIQNDLMIVRASSVHGMSKKKKVSHLVPWVSSWFVLVLFVVGFVCFESGRHLAFCFHLFSNMWE